MSRYILQDASYPHYPRQCWVVLDEAQDGTEIGIGRYFSEAEASIIAFALNAVAEGHHLYSRPRVWHGDVPYGEAQFTRYDGPTEGVAPDRPSLDRARV